MRVRTLIAGVLIVVGLVWIGQGLGIIRGSGFMTDDVTWAIVGAVLLAVGVVVAATVVRSRPRA
jgi:predicted membrane protein